MTVEEYFKFTDSVEEKYDYVYGEVVRVAGASFDHGEITSNLSYWFRDAIRYAEAGCRVYGSDVRLHTGTRLYRYPNMMISDAAPRVGSRGELLNPAVIAEILSDSTQADDRTDKFGEYQQIASFCWYLLIEQDRVHVTVYGKQDSGLWAITGVYTDLADTLTITINGKAVSVRLTDIYEGVFEADTEDEQTGEPA